MSNCHFLSFDTWKLFFLILHAWYIVPDHFCSGTQMLRISHAFTLDKVIRYSLEPAIKYSFVPAIKYSFVPARKEEQFCTCTAPKLYRYRVKPGTVTLFILFHNEASNCWQRGQTKMIPRCSFGAIFVHFQIVFKFNCKANNH